MDENCHFSLVSHFLKKFSRTVFALFSHYLKFNNFQDDETIGNCRISREI